MKDFDKAIELDPKYSWSFVQRGYTLLRLGQTEQAVEDFKKGARLGNTNAQNYLTRKGVQW
jgi:tetratricopeptide (TPR) repeat protein